MQHQSGLDWVEEVTSIVAVTERHTCTDHATLCTSWISITSQNLCCLHSLVRYGPGQPQPVSRCTGHSWRLGQWLPTSSKLCDPAAHLQQYIPKCGCGGLWWTGRLAPLALSWQADKHVMPYAAQFIQCTSGSLSAQSHSCLLYLSLQVRTYTCPRVLEQASNSPASRSSFRLSINWSGEK
jgi:hypothetical protein